MSSKSEAVQTELSDAREPISAVRFSPSSRRLLVSSWDRNIYLYDLEKKALTQTFEHRAPILDVCWGDAEEEIFSVGLDCDVRRYVAFHLFVIGPTAY